MIAPFFAQLSKTLHFNLKIIVWFTVGFVGGFHLGISRRLGGFIHIRLPYEFHATFIFIIHRWFFIG